MKWRRRGIRSPSVVGVGLGLAGNPFRLLSHVVAYWKLDEATAATRASSVGSEDLTDHNSVAQAAGKLGNAAQFTAASSMYLERVSDAVLQNGSGDFFLACWYKPATTGDQALVTKGGSAGGTYDYELSLISTKFFFEVKDNAAGFASVSANTFGVVTSGSFYFVLAYYDRANNQIGISVNGGAFDTAAVANPLAGNSAAPFRLSSYSNNNSFADGILDAVVLGKPTVAIAGVKNSIRSALWNGGNGLEYPW